MTDTTIASQFGHVYLLELVERLLKAESLERAMLVVGSYLKFGVPISGLTLILKIAPDKYQIHMPLIANHASEEIFELPFSVLSQIMDAHYKPDEDLILPSVDSQKVAELIQNTKDWERFPVGLSADCLGFALMNVPDTLGQSEHQFIRGVCEHIALTILRFQHIFNLEEISQHVSSANLELREREEHLKKSNQRLQATLDELNHAQEELIEVRKHASLGKLVRGVAHEINTPTGVCMTASTALQDICEQLIESTQQKSLTQSQFENKLNSIADMTELLQRNCTRIANLVSTFKLASTDEWTEKAVSFDLPLVLQNTVHRAYQRIDKRPLVHIETDIQHTLWGYPTVLSEALVNLLNNAFQYACQNPSSQVWLIAKKRTDNVCINIIDEGPGMTAEQQEKFFEPFMTSSHHHDNLGLGTHITYNLITQKYGGQIKVKSRPLEPVNIEIIIPLIVKHESG